MPTGSPHSGPGGSPRASRRSSSRAAAGACGFSVTTALMTGWWRSSRARQAWRTATGETSRAAISRAISAAGRSASSVATPYPLRPLAPVSLKRHHARERGLASLELPREAPDDEPLVLELGGVDLAAQVLDVDAVLREQRVVRQLIRGVREHPVDRLLAAELLLRLGSHPVAASRFWIICGVYTASSSISCRRSTITPGRHSHSSGSSSIVLPAVTKWRGASRCVPMWFEVMMYWAFTPCSALRLMYFTSNGG